MSKFLRTVQKIDGINQKVILQVDNCNHCPLMKFHNKSCLATCRMFSSAQGNIVDDFVLDYNVNTGEIYGDIDIPDWCALAENVEQLDFDNRTYTIHDGKVLTNENAIIDRDLPVYIAADLNKPLTDSKVESLLPALVAASVMRGSSKGINDLSADEAYEIAYSEYDDFYDDEQSYTPPTKKYDICSLCGEEDNSVNRNTNHGMCDSCWEGSHDNAERKKQAFINNFRMKRGEDFQKEPFNLSVLKTDSLKVLITTK